MDPNASTPQTRRAVLAKVRYVPPALIALGVSAAPHTTFGASGVQRGNPQTVTADACKNGGWRALGFRNQGQCIQAVNTGK